MTAPERLPWCKACGRQATTEPQVGWYNLTVQTARKAGNRPYRWLGVFCSAACLSSELTRLGETEAQIRSRPGWEVTV